MDGHNQLTVELPQSEIDFVRTYAARNNVTVDNVIDTLIIGLEQKTSRRIDPELQSLVGILPSNADVDALRMEYLTEKYLKDDRNGWSECSLGCASPAR